MKDPQSMRPQKECRPKQKKRSQTTCSVKGIKQSRTSQCRMVRQTNISEHDLLCHEEFPDISKIIFHSNQSKMSAPSSMVKHEQRATAVVTPETVSRNLIPSISSAAIPQPPRLSCNKLFLSPDCSRSPIKPIPSFYETTSTEHGCIGFLRSPPKHRRSKVARSSPASDDWSLSEFLDGILTSPCHSIHGETMAIHKNPAMTNLLHRDIESYVDELDAIDFFNWPQDEKTYNVLE